MNWKELRIWMVKRGYTYQGLADLMGVKHAAVNGWQHRDNVPGYVPAHIKTIEENERLISKFEKLKDKV
jgi:predicted transcriptional regulator